MIKIVISAFAIIMIISSCESDNPESKRWVTISGRDMTLDNPVQKIICDDSDNIWFASYGVSRFDGKFWHTYGEKDGFTNISIKDMDIDRTGNVFFGNEFEGLKKYNGEEFLNLDITK
jgi:ligand-binding sensor domain-containing protein